MTCADFFAKKWSDAEKWNSYALAFAFYFVALNVFLFSLKSKNVAIATAILVTFNTVSLVLLSHFYFHEKITPVQMVGLALSVVAVILLESGS